MTRFETTEGQSLGVTFCGDLGTTQDGSKETKRTLFQSEDEKKLWWELDEDDTVLEDGCERKVGMLRDWFFKECRLVTEEELVRRGWGDRLETGLGFRTGVTEDGRLVTMR